jgi:hypothetical protein
MAEMNGLEGKKLALELQKEAERIFFRPWLGFCCLLGVVVFLLCWKALRQLFMRMVSVKT